MWGSYRKYAAKIVCTWCTEAKRPAFCLTQEYEFPHCPNMHQMAPFDECASIVCIQFVHALKPQNNKNCRALIQNISYEGQTMYS